MGEMDIYMRRRLVALGGLVGFFIIFVLLVKSCGDDDSETPVTTVGTTDTAAPTLLTRNEYIAQADAICAEANSSVGSLDPADPQATADEFEITSGELAQLRQLEPEKKDPTLKEFLSRLTAVVKALESKATALERGDTVTAEEAQVDIDTNEVDARELGTEYGFSDCGQFLDAGEGPSAGGTGATAAPGTDTGTGAVPVTPTTTTPVTPTETTPVTPTEPPADDSGGITP